MSSRGLMKKRGAGIFQLIKHIYETAINDFHAIFQSNCRHYLTTLPNFDRSKILIVYETICEGGPPKLLGRSDGWIERYA
jgi:hypothetical protein